MRIIAVIGLILIGAMVVSGSCLAETFTRQQIIKESAIDKACYVEPFMDCLNINKSDCNRAVEKCMVIFPESMGEGELPELFDKFDKCMNDALSVTSAKMDSCDAALQNGLLQMPDEEIYGMDIDQPIMEFGNDSEIRQAIEESGIPLYRDAIYMASIDEAQAMQIVSGDIKPLSAAVYVSTDNFAQVVEFYRKSIPDYNEYGMEDGSTLLLKDGPESFDFSKNYKDYFTKQHVMIEKVKDELVMAPEGTKVKIEISFGQ
jgi:hypothetical protein